MRPFLEAVRPLVSFLVALVLFMIWATYSPNNILEADPRLFFYLSGMVPYKQADLQSQGKEILIYMETLANEHFCRSETRGDFKKWH